MNNDAIRQFVRRELRAVTVGVATAIGIGGVLPVALAGGLTGGTVVSGQGSITSPGPTTTLITQQSNQLTLNWSTFNVASNETVRFVQPSSTSVALNNILSQSPSQIFGEIDANGRVVLVNPNGILFGRTAQLNVGSLIASSLEVKEFDPTTGHLSFQSPSGQPGAIDNEGTITAGPGGSVVLLGGTVLNNGLVVADYGTVAMGAGQVATLDFFGGGLLRLQISGDVKTNSTGANAAVQNNGQIDANGGQVLLTASATQDVFASAVDNAGVIKAARIRNVGGVIQLLGTDGAASDSGALDASGAGATSTGGTVTVTGNSVSLASTARVDVSGAAGGGSAYIGGGLHGADSSVPNASSTSIDSGASIDADATGTGNGGTIAVWSDGTTTAHGSLSANGGPAGGNGGMIETSGHVLDATGISVRAGAPAGTSGLWLLDPFNVVIDSGSGNSISGGNNGTNATVFDADINAALFGTGAGDGTDVTIETSQPKATTSTSVGTITFGAGVSITNNDTVAHTLTLFADTGIDLSNTTAPSITSGTGGLNLVLTANANGEATTASLGTVTFDGTINVSTLNVTATAPITQTGGSITVAGATTLSDAGNDITLTSAANSFKGNVAFTGANVTLTNAGALSTSGAASGNLSETAGGTISEGTAGIQLGGTAGTNTATFTVTSATANTYDVDLGGSTLNNFNDEATTITSGGSATVGNVRVADTNATFVPLTLPATLTSLVLSDPTTNAQITLAAETLTGVGTGNNLAGTSDTLDVTSGGGTGGIGQSGRLSVTGTTSLNANGGTIDLNDVSTNIFGGNVAFAGSAVTLDSVSALSTSGTASGNLNETAGGNITEGTAGIQMGGTAGANTATFTVASVITNTYDVNLGGSSLNNFNNDATTITHGASATVGNVSVADTNATFVPLTLPGTLTSLVLSDPTASAQIAIPGETLTGVGAGQNLAGTSATLDVTSGGAITQSGALSVTGTTELSGGAITLNNTSNAFNGSLFVTGGAVTLANSDATTLQGTDSASSLTIDAGGTVTFGFLASDGTTVTNGLIVQGLNGSGTATGGLVSQVGKLSVGTTTSIDAGTNDITLSDSANVLAGAVTLTGAAVTLANSDATTLAGLNSASSLTLDAGGAVTFGAASSDATNVTNGLIIQGSSGSGAAGGAVTQVGKLVVGTTTAIDTGTNAITLSDTSNAFIGPVTVTGGAVTLANANATTLAGASSASSLTLDAAGTVTFGTAATDSTNVTNGLIVQGVTGSGAAGGAVSQVGKLVVGTTSDIDAGGNAITLADSSNSFGGNVGFTGAAVTLASAGGLSASGTASGNLSETAGGTISEGSAGIQLGGTAGANTATFIVTGATHDVNLGNAANNFNDDATTIAASGSGAVGNVSVADINATFVPLTLPGTLKSLVLSDSTANAQIVLRGATLTGVGAGTNLAGTSATLDVTSGGGATGTITQSGALVVNGTTSLNANGGTIDLGTATNSFSGNVAFAGSAVTLTSSGALSSSGTASGTLTETAGGTISEGGSIQVTAGNTASFTVSGGTWDVNLGNASNNFNDDVTTIQASGGAVGNVMVADTNTTFVPLTLPGTLTSLVLSDPNAPITLPAQTLNGVGAGTNLAGGATTLAVTSGGLITQSGPLAVNGSTALNAGAADITLSSTSNDFVGNVAFTGSAVTLANAGALSSSGTASGNLSETAGGTVSQGGTLSVAGTTSINAGANAITLSNATNALAGSVTLSGGAVTLANSDATTLAGANSASSLTLDAGGAVTFGTASTDTTIVASGLTVRGASGSGAAGGAVSEVGTLSVGGASTINAGGNAIALGNPSNSFGGNVGFAGGAVTLANAGALSSSGTASGTLSEAAGGAISEGTAGIQLSGTSGTNTSTFTVTGAPGTTYDVDLGSSATNNFNGEATTITASGGAAVGNVRVADTNTTFVPLTLPGTLTSLVLTDPNAPITIAAQTLTGVGAGTNLAGGTTALDVTSGGLITQSGALAVSGTTSLNSNAGAGNITLSNSGNAFSGNIAFTGAAVTLANAGALSTSGTATGNLSETAGGTVSQGGTLSVAGTISINAGTNDITLSNASNALAGSVTLSGGAVTLANSDATTLAGANSASSLTLDAGGAVNLGAAGTDTTTVANGLIVQGSSGSGAAGGAVSQAGMLSVGGTSNINAGGNAIRLGNASNSLNGNVGFVGGTVTLANAGALSSSGTASGNLIETSGGAITQGGALSVTGSSTLTASGGAGNITLTNPANAFAGPVALIGGTVTLANAGAMTLAGTKVASLTLDAGGAVTFGTASTDSTSVTNGLIVQGVSGSGAAGGGVSENGTLTVGGTTSIDAGTNDITLEQANTFSGAVTFTGRNVALLTGGNLTSSGTAAGTLTEIAKGPSSQLNIGTLSAGGDVLLIAGSSIVGTGSQPTVTANNVELRYGIENPAAQLTGFGLTAPSSSQVSLIVWAPQGSPSATASLRQSISSIQLTQNDFPAGQPLLEKALYTDPFGTTAAAIQQQVALAQAITTSSTYDASQSLNTLLSNASSGLDKSVLYIDWSSYNPNVSLFGTLNPAVCLPADQREEGVGSGSGCAAASASLFNGPTPILLAMVPTREGLKPMPLFSLAQ
jgi:filamentous hemagglutinin family protein